MGIILGPVLIFWLGASLYSLRVGYVLLSGKTLYPDALIVLGVAILAMLSYVFWGLSKFRRKDRLWTFEILWFFTVSLPALVVFSFTLLVHIYAGDYIENEYAKLVPFMVMFMISVGTVLGSFSANSFMERHGIVKTF